MSLPLHDPEHATLLERLGRVYAHGTHLSEKHRDEVVQKSAIVILGKGDQNPEYFTSPRLQARVLHYVFFSVLEWATRDKRRLGERHEIEPHMAQSRMADSPPAILTAQEGERRIVAAIGSLPPRYSAVAEGLWLREEKRVALAKRLGLSPAALDKRAERARNMLSKIIGPGGDALRTRRAI